MNFPTFAFHKTLAPEGKLISSQPELEALGEGWVDTPAAFDPNYIRPPKSVPDGTVPADALARGFVPQPYPSFRFNAAGDSIVVANEDEDEALDPDVWRHSPAEFPPTARPFTVTSVPDVATAESAPAPLTDVEEAERKAANELAAKARELHATSVADVQKALDGCPDKAMLQKVKDMEMLNPAGPRITLVRFIDTTIKALDAPATPAAPADSAPATPQA